MPRFERDDSFWEISVNGKSFTTKWGRTGKPEQEKTITLPTAAAAKAAADKQVEAKLSQGFVRLTKAKPPAPTTGGSDEQLPGSDRWVKGDQFFEIAYDGKLTITIREGTIGTAGTTRQIKGSV